MHRYYKIVWKKKLKNLLNWKILRSLRNILKMHSLHSRLNIFDIFQILLQFLISKSFDPCHILSRFNNQILGILKFFLIFHSSAAFVYTSRIKFKHLKWYFPVFFAGQWTFIQIVYSDHFWLTRSFFRPRLRNNRRWLHEEKCIVSAIGETCNLHESVQESRGINLAWAGANGCL